MGRKIAGYTMSDDMVILSAFGLTKYIYAVIGTTSLFHHRRYKMPRITIRLKDSEYERIGQNATKAGITYPNMFGERLPDIG